jgi:hypothetical protein
VTQSRPSDQDLMGEKNRGEMNSPG